MSRRQTDSCNPWRYWLRRRPKLRTSWQRRNRQQSGWALERNDWGEWGKPYVRLHRLGSPGVPVDFTLNGPVASRKRYGPRLCLDRPTDQASRRVRAGSTASARRVGIHEAIKPIAAMDRTADTRMIGSPGEAWYMIALII